jgi:uncharacterized protein YjbI with pentapeptide repeats
MKKRFIKPDQILQNRINSNKEYQQDDYKGVLFRSRVREKFEGIDFSHQDLTGVELCRDIGDIRYPAIFKNCNLKNTILIDARVAHVRWIGCDVTGADFTGTGVQPEQFINCPGSEDIFAKPRRSMKQKRHAAGSEPEPFVA